MSLRSLGLLVLATTAIFALALACFRVPLTADDYGLIAASLKGFGALWKIEGPLVARLPVGNGLSIAGLELGLWERWPALFLTLGFAVHATAFALLADWVRERFAIGAGLALVAFLPHALFPNDHEMHFWYSVVAFQAGALAAALGLRARRDWARIACFTLAFLSYETYVFLIAGALALEWIAGARLEARAQETLGSLARLALPAGAALVLTVLIRAALAHAIGGTNERTMDFQLGHVPWILKSMLVLNFRKENWPIGSLEWAAIILLVALEGRRRPRLAFALLIPFVAALPVALLPYQATRALYGPDLLRAAVLAALTASLLSRKEVSRWLKAIPVALFVLSYGYEWAHILSIKDANARALAALENETRARISACASPCSLEVPAPGSVTRDDWVIHPGYYAAFYERLRLETAPEKPVSFVIRWLTRGSGPDPGWQSRARPSFRPRSTISG